MTSLKLTVADPSTVAQLELDITSTVYQKLADYCYKPTAVYSADAAANVRHLQPNGKVWTEQLGNQVEVKVRDVDVDKEDLFIAVLADLQQRIDGLTGEIS